MPSPTSSSCVFATSTIIFAAGCSISISFRIVAPSFVIVTSPIESTSILSMPFGPKVVRTLSATALAAIIFLLCASLPVFRSVPSGRINIGCPPSCPFIFKTPFQYSYFIHKVLKRTHLQKQTSSSNNHQNVYGSILEKYINLTFHHFFTTLISSLAFFIFLSSFSSREGISISALLFVIASAFLPASSAKPFM